jgi:hypothetical protein
LQLFDYTEALLYRADTLRRANEVKMKAMTSTKMPRASGALPHGWIALMRLAAAASVVEERPQFAAA